MRGVGQAVHIVRHEISEVWSTAMSNMRFSLDQKIQWIVAFFWSAWDSMLRLKRLWIERYVPVSTQFRQQTEKLLDEKLPDVEVQVKKLVLDSAEAYVKKNQTTQKWREAKTIAEKMERSLREISIEGANEFSRFLYARWEHFYCDRTKRARLIKSYLCQKLSDSDEIEKLVGDLLDKYFVKQKVCFSKEAQSAMRKMQQTVMNICLKKLNKIIEVGEKSLCGDRTALVLIFKNQLIKSSQEKKPFTQVEKSFLFETASNYIRHNLSYKDQEIRSFANRLVQSLKFVSPQKQWDWVLEWFSGQVKLFYDSL